MDKTILKKMKFKEGMTTLILYASPEYPNFEDFSSAEDTEDDNYNFVHLFVTSKAEFCQRFPESIDAVSKDGLLWISYPKSDKKQKYDINRDSLWSLVLPLGWHPVAQVSLDENWSAIRLKQNEPGVEYKMPGNTKKKE